MRHFVMCMLALLLTAGCALVQSKDQKLSAIFDLRNFAVEAVTEAVNSDLISVSRAVELQKKLGQARVGLEKAQAILVGFATPVVENGEKKDFKYWLQYSKALITEVKKQLPKVSWSAPPQLSWRLA